MAVYRLTETLTVVNTIILEADSDEDARTRYAEGDGYIDDVSEYGPNLDTVEVVG